MHVVVRLVVSNLRFPTNQRIRSLAGHGSTGFSPSIVAMIYATGVTSVPRFAATVLVLGLAMFVPPLHPHMSKAAVGL